MKKIQLWACVAIATFTLAACSSRNNNVANHIPKNASVVVAVNAGQMLTKMEADGMNPEQVLKDVNGIKSADLQDAIAKWKELKDAGVDWDQPFFIVAVADTAKKGDPQSLIMLATVKDADKLAATVKTQMGAEASKSGGIFKVSAKGASMAWDDEMLVATVSENQSTEAAVYFDVKAKEAITSTKHFNESLSRNADILIYSGSSAFNDPQAAMALAIVPKAKELLSDIETVSWINFEKGKATLTNQTFVGEALAKLLDKYAGPEIDQKLIERFSGSELNAVAAFSFKPQIIVGVLEELGFSSLASISLAQEGITLEDIEKVFKGDFAIMVGGLNVPDKSQAKNEGVLDMNVPQGNLIAVARIGDMAVMDKLIAKATEKGLLSRNGNSITFTDDADMEDLKMGIEGDLLVISNNADAYAQYVSGKTTPLNSELQSAMKGQSAALFVNIQSILNQIPDQIATGNTAESAALAEAKKIFKSSNIYLSNYKNGSLSGGAELHLNGTKNSLSQLAELMVAVANAETGDTAKTP